MLGFRICYQHTLGEKNPLSILGGSSQGLQVANPNSQSKKSMKFAHLENQPKTPQFFWRDFTMGCMAPQKPRIHRVMGMILQVVTTQRCYITCLKSP